MFGQSINKEMNNKGSEAIIFDFDDTLYLNFDKDFDSISTGILVRASYFFECFLRQHPCQITRSTPQFLITGRHPHQRMKILMALKERGYKILQDYFFPFPRENLEPQKFAEYYHSFKINQILQLTEYYDTLFIFEDNRSFCAELKGLNLDSLKIFLVALFRDLGDSLIEFLPIHEEKELTVK